MGNQNKEAPAAEPASTEALQPNITIDKETMKSNIQKIMKVFFPPEVTLKKLLEEETRKMEGLMETKKNLEKAIIEAKANKEDNDDFMARQTALRQKEAQLRKTRENIQGQTTRGRKIKATNSSRGLLMSEKQDIDRLKTQIDARNANVGQLRNLAKLIKDKVLNDIIQNCENMHDTNFVTLTQQEKIALQSILLILTTTLDERIKALEKAQPKIIVAHALPEPSSEEKILQDDIEQYKDNLAKNPIAQLQKKLQETEKMLEKPADTRANLRYNNKDHLHIRVKRNLIDTVHPDEANALNSAVAYCIGQLEGANALAQYFLKQKCKKAGWVDTGTGDFQYSEPNKLPTMSKILELTYSFYLNAPEVYRLPSRLSPEILSIFEQNQGILRQNNLVSQTQPDTQNKPAEAKQAEAINTLESGLSPEIPQQNKPEEAKQKPARTTRPEPPNRPPPPRPDAILTAYKKAIENPNTDEPPSTDYADLTRPRR